MRRLTTEIRSEKCVVRQFRRCANVIECTYTNLDSIACYSQASLNDGVGSMKCVVRRFRRCANVIACTHTNLDSIAYCTPRLYGIAYCCYATNLYSMLLY
jgi:hypothetical protein